jgi:beta-phosphoglucomutase-like phosphatase (HAD superfamily)
MGSDEFVLGTDLDGVCADFYEIMRQVVAEWLGVPIERLPKQVTYGLSEWGLTPAEYEKVHRFAVTQRELFRTVPPISGAVQSLRRLADEGIRIRIITHRLFMNQFHQIAVAQTVEWLDRYGFPYKDLCFMRDKGEVDANIYVEDTDEQIWALENAGRKVIAFSNSTNTMMDPAPAMRADTWQETEDIVRRHYNEWRRARGLTFPDSANQVQPS